VNATSNPSARGWLERAVLPGWPIRWEHVLFGGLVIFAVITRFVDLGVRVMSHDESLHVYYSWRFYKGQGYQHTPMMHGPLQFHLIALSYFLFGDSDFTARIPHALASVLTIVALWPWRRYLGRVGTLIAAGLMLISPYMLYYGRYARNEAFVALFGVIMLWAILRYLETGADRYLYWLTLATILHYTAKETSFIYTAQALVFLGLLVLTHALRTSWHRDMRSVFMFALFVTGVLFTFAMLVQIGVQVLLEKGIASEKPLTIMGFHPFAAFFILAGLITLLIAVLVLLFAYDWRRLRALREVHLIVLQLSLILPMLAPLPASLLRGHDVYVDAADVSRADFLINAGFVTLHALLGLGLVLWLWDWRRWWPQALLFWAVFTFFYTSAFTNIAGFGSGIVGSLGYWLAQQGVKRGNQPWYYYLVIHIPIYEYLPALGFLLAGVSQFVARLRSSAFPRAEDAATSEGTQREDARPLAFALLWYWSLTSVIAYTLAGEKMPWLTVHITWPMILTTAWWLARVIQGIPWSEISWTRLGLLFSAMIFFVLSFSRLLSSLLGPHPDMSQGRTLDVLTWWGGLLLFGLVAAFSAVAIARLSQALRLSTLLALATLGFFLVLAGFTWHTAYQATYINYDQANEFLVYAHSAHGVRVAMDQIEAIAFRLYDGRDMPVAYDDAVSWPMSWYFRNYPNQRYYGAEPTRTLRDVPVILVGARNYGKIGPVVGDLYYEIEYIRMVWPMEDYRNLTWERIKNALLDPQMRAALRQIWLHRDFSLYAKIKGRDDLRPSNWNPSDRMRLYIRKDVAAKMWEFGLRPTDLAVEKDPFDERTLTTPPIKAFGQPGVEPGQFQGPRDVAVAADGTLYIADTFNHRIQHIDPETGEVLHLWGGPTDPNAPRPDQLNEPWGIAVGPDGRVYVADTWNHSIKVFSPEGQLLQVWTSYGEGEPTPFWGPRDVAVDADGYVYVTDTGNKRIVVFRTDGTYVTHIGGPGALPGQFDEPVGITVGPDGLIYVADTWNQRIQVLQPLGDGELAAFRTWDVHGWYGQGMENKPYLAVDDLGRVYVTDPEARRVLVFDAQGQPLVAWAGDITQPLGIVNGIAWDATRGVVWVTDATHGRVLAWAVPTDEGAAEQP